ncbi:MAG TPA: DUF6569 family protein [Gemmata sp.]|nr:DUF6569 family protein [Gemmata sp.]
MKSSHAALAVVGLALAGLWYAGGGSAPRAAAAAGPRVSAPVSHENLTVYFVHGPDAIANAKIVTLQEAIDAGWAVVHETGNVNQLAVENLSSEYELFVQDGDMIRGGKQDRVVATDLLVPPRSGAVPLPAHCVEAGRWTNRGGEAATHFNKSDQFAVGNALRYANASGQQSEVWKNVKEQQKKLSENLNVVVNAPESETSLQLALENPAVRAKVAEFEQALRAAGEAREGVVGVVFVLNGQVYGHEEYGSNALFRKAWPKLLKSAAADAVAEKTDRPTPPAPGVREVECFLAYGGPATAGAGAVAEDVPVLRERMIRDQRRIGVQTHDLLAQPNSPDVRNLDAEFTRLSGVRLEASPQPGSVTESRTGSFMFGGGYNSDTPAGLNPGDPQPDARNRARPDLRVFGTYDIAGNGGRVANVPTQGNRLSVNRVDGAAGLVTESRDPSRQNAVIHKSFIKK